MTRDIALASYIIGELREFFDDTDNVREALTIADIVCGQDGTCLCPCGQDDAEMLIRAVGDVLGIVLEWKEASPETIGKVKAIRSIALTWDWMKAYSAASH